MSGLARDGKGRDGTGGPVSRDQVIRRQRDRREIIFSVTRTASSIGSNILMYVCVYGHTYSKSMDQPGKVANPARGQLNRENEHFPALVRA